MIQVSERLQTVAGMVKSKGTVADIGCDHGFTSIYLIQQGLAQKAIAMDIREGPLQSAREHIRQYGLERQIATRLSDGARELLPYEADTLLISGMGGALLCRILRDSPQVVQACRELVLSPQSELHLVRHLLHEIGFRITEEAMLKEQGKYYIVLRAVPGEEHYSREEEYIYGKKLILSGSDVLKEYLKKEQNRVERILDSFQGKSEQALQRRAELEQTRKQIIRTLQETEKGGEQNGNAAYQGRGN